MNNSDVTLCKFSPISDEISTGYVIRIVSDIPDLPLPESTHVDFFDDQATVLAHALFSSLPQGTLDRLLIKLMNRKLSLYHGQTKS